MGADLSRPRGYLLDLDGTLYAGGAAVAGATEALKRLRRSRTPYRLVTNTTSRSRAGLVDRLHQYGFEVGPDEIFTATVAGCVLARTAGYHRLAPFIMEPALEDMEGVELVGGTSGRAADRLPQAIILGDLGERWTYGLLQEAFEYLMAGAEFIALSRDKYWLNQGQLALDAGPFAAALEFATGRNAIVAGKPSPQFYAAALQSLGIETAAAVAMVGDDLWSDVEGAQRAGVQGWLVRTGKYRESALQGSGITPDRILESIAELG
ncbi:MAG: TIGR01458 family HAD-type hydrolase [Gemmatimonadales bacterium]